MRHPSTPSRHRRPGQSLWRRASGLAVAFVLMCTGFIAAVPAAQAADYCLPNMAYTKGNASEKSRIFFRSNCGKTVTQLTAQTDTSQDTAPRVSPDGTTVVFVRSFSAPVNVGTGYDLFSVSTAGGEATRLTQTPEQPKFGADWSPDSQRIVFDSGDNGGRGRIFTINRDGSGLTQLTAGDEANDASPCWSLDNRIAFQRYQVSNAGSGTNIFVANPDGSSLRAVTNTMVEKYRCHWSPDSNYIFYDEVTNPNTGTYVAAVASVATGKTARLGTTGAILPAMANDWSLAVGVPADAPAYGQIGLYNFTTNSYTVPFPATGSRETSPSFVRSGAIGARPAGFPPAGLDEPAPGPDPTPGPTPGPDPTPVANKIWAGGDSFTSGEGAKDPELGYMSGTSGDSNHTCHRSFRAYPVLVARKLGRGLNFHACSGAVLADYGNPFAQVHGGKNPAEPAQRDTITKQHSIGLLSLGGNNMDFATVMEYCAVRAPYQPSCEKTYGKHVDRLLSNLQRSDVLERLYRNILARMAPGARLYVVGYPRFFPVRPPGSCSTGAPLPQQPVFTRADMVWINNSISRLNVIYLHAVAKVARAKFVDVYDAFKGHEICNTSGKEEWMNKVILGDRAESFHPNVAGQAALAESALKRVKA